MDGNMTQAAPETVTTLPSSRAIMIAGLKSSRRKIPGTPRLPEHSLLLPRARLEERKIAQYARVCGFTPAQGVPPTYPHILAFPLHMMLMMRDDFPFPLIGLVHLANTIRQSAPLSYGDALAITVGFGGFVAHDKGQAFTVEASAARDGELVWESTSTYLRLGVKSPQGEPAPAQPAGPMPLRVSGRFRLAADLGKRYAAVSGDANPIHTSRLGARAFGFKRPIAHGMWSKARALAALLPQAPVATADIDVAFKTPAFLPGTALLLSTRTADTTIFELRDGNAEKPHLRGLLRAVPV